MSCVGREEEDQGHDLGVAHTLSLGEVRDHPGRMISHDQKGRIKSAACSPMTKGRSASSTVMTCCVRGHWWFRQG